MNHCNKAIKGLVTLGMILPLLGLVSCSSKLPIVNNSYNYHQSPYGAYIEMKVQGIQEKLNFKGELIAVDKNKVVIRTIGKKETVRPFAIKDILSYKIYYAKNEKENYKAWNILLSTVLISHGFFSILTFPINALVFMSVDGNKREEFGYSKKNISIQGMSKFARYPQGLPPHINLENLQDIMLK